MTSVRLRRTLLDRVVRPYAFFVSLATFVVTLALITNEAVGALLKGAPGDVLAVLGIATIGLLWAGWWFKNDVLMVRGLLWSAGVWAGVGAVLLIDNWTAWVSPALAFCWAGMSAVSWWLEYDDLKRSRVR